MLFVFSEFTKEVVKIREYTSSITNNFFSGNEIGQKGSAIYARQISYLEIEDNEFKKNLPGYAFRKDVYRPYELAF